jgi:hypothetical protein
MDPDILRALERILGVCIGGLSVYLGYRLFLAVPDRTDGEGKFVYRDISVVLSRVGPGVFFALFGAAVVASSFFNAITYSESLRTAPERAVAAAEEGPSGGVVKAYSGAGGRGAAVADETPSAPLRARVRRDIATLNALASEALIDLDGARRTDVNNALDHAKQAMLSTVWGKDCGDYEDFARWISLANGGDSPPREFAEPAAYYRAGAD